MFGTGSKAIRRGQPQGLPLHFLGILHFNFTTLLAFFLLM